MQTLEESREGFNQFMNPYIAIIVQTPNILFDNSFFVKERLNIPIKREYYTPPSWVGPTYSSEFLEFFWDPRFNGMRQEIIPSYLPQEKYLVCDDYSSNGDTIEIAIIRLLEQRVKLNNIWVFTPYGNRETGYQRAKVLDKAIEWHNYCVRQINPLRQALQELKFKFPKFPN